MAPFRPLLRRPSRRIHTARVPIAALAVLAVACTGPVPPGPPFDGPAVVLEVPTGEVGISVAMTDQYAAAGGDEFVMVYRRDGDQWEPIQRLTVPGATGEVVGFGRSVAVYKDLIAVGAHLVDDGAEDAGAVYLYELNDGTWEYDFTLHDNSPLADEGFGTAVAIGEGFVFVGAPDDVVNGDPSGSVSVFINHAVTGWTLLAKLEQEDQEANDAFGWSLDVSGDDLVVGDQGDELAGLLTGAAYVFRLVANVWQHEQKLTAPVPTAVDEFGQAVAVDGDTILVSAFNDDEGGVDTGAVYVFEHGATWTITAKLMADEPQDASSFGSSVDLDLPLAVVGASEFDAPADYSGAAFVYERGAEGWSQLAMLRSPDPAVDSFLGSDIAISGDHVLVAQYGPPRLVAAFVR